MKVRSIVLALCLVAFLATGALAGEPFPSGMTLGAADERGLFPVLAIEPATPADMAGIEVQDWISEIDGIRMAGLLPGDVETHIAKRLAEGWSSIVVFYREGKATATRIRPLRLSVQQREMLLFRRIFNHAALRINEIWRESHEQFDSYLFRGLTAEELDGALFHAANELRDAEGELLSLKLPGEGIKPGNIPFTHIHPTAVKRLIEAQGYFGQGQVVRLEVLGLMRDFAWKRNGVYGSDADRWKTMYEREAQASRLMALARGALLDALSFVALDGGDLTQLLEIEEGEVERLAAAKDLEIAATPPDAAGVKRLDTVPPLPMVPLVHVTPSVVEKTPEIKPVPSPKPKPKKKKVVKKPAKELSDAEALALIEAAAKKGSAGEPVKAPTPKPEKPKPTPAPTKAPEPTPVVTKAPEPTPVATKAPDPTKAPEPTPVLEEGEMEELSGDAK